MVDVDNCIVWFEVWIIVGYLVLVSEEDGVVMGYVLFGDWCSFDGFCYIVEYLVYVYFDYQGKGLGCKLLS